MTKHLDPESLPLRPPSDAPQERLCRRCKGSSTWRSSVQFAPSTGRQR